MSWTVDQYGAVTDWHGDAPERDPERNPETPADDDECDPEPSPSAGTQRRQ